MSKKDGSEKFWLYAFRDHLANIKAFSSCLITADIAADGDYHLLIADGSKKLKVYSGTALQRESRLFQVPICMASFYMLSDAAFQKPIVAVASGAFVFMYQGEEPLMRFTIPLIKISDEEKTIWEQLGTAAITIDEAVQRFEVHLDAGLDVTAQTLEFVLMDSNQERAAFVGRVRGKPLLQLDCVTCMTSIYLEREEERGLGTLVIGTERRFLYILKNNGSAIDTTFSLPSIPVELVVAGTLRVDYRIFVSCRDGRIYSIKNGQLHSSIIQPDAQPVGFVRYNNQIAVATMANTLSYYNLKGKRQSATVLPTNATNLATIDDPVSGEQRAVIVALSNGQIRVYVGTQLQHVSQAYGTVTAMRSGRYGREDSVLMMVLQNGSLVVELLHRNAQLSGKGVTETGPPPEQEMPIPVPRLSSVFQVQTEREKTCGLEMYRTYSVDLCHLRLSAARSYLKLISNGQVDLDTESDDDAAVAEPLESVAPAGAAPSLTATAADAEPSAAKDALSRETSPVNAAAATAVTTGLLSPTKHGALLGVLAEDSVRIVATVQGLGPSFKIKLLLQNISDHALFDLKVVFSYAKDIYNVPQSFIRVPYVVPSMAFPCEVVVELQEGETKGDGVTVLVVDEHRRRPLAHAIVDLPEADLIEGL